MDSRGAVTADSSALSVSKGYGTPSDRAPDMGEVAGREAAVRKDASLGVLYPLCRRGVIPAGCGWATRGREGVGAG
jgi:hypothetical protein